MKLTCPDCRKPVPAEDVNIKLAIAKCLACDAVFSLTEQIGEALRSVRNNLPLAPPKNWRVDDFGPELTISWRWYSHAIWILVFFALFWDGFVVVWYSIGIRGFLGQRKIDWGLLVMLVFPVLHVAAGVAITYGCVAAFVNKTLIRLGGGELSVYQGPLPVSGNRRVQCIDISQLFCTESTSRGKNGSSYAYNLNALLTNGERITLVKNFQDPFEPLYLEQLLEERLKIADERVPGDWVG